MNDRINELKSQCIFRETRGTDASNSYVVDRFDTEKFAELIVEECAKRAEVYAYMSPNFTALAEELRRMIGVEE